MSTGSRETAARGEGPAPRRVMVLRQWDSQVGGSGCCGRLSSGVTSDLGDAADYAHARECMVDMGAVYRAFRAEWPDTDVTVADTRNWAWLVPAVLKDARRAGLPWPRALQQVVRATTPAAVVVDGVVVSSGSVPSPAEALAAARLRLGRPEAPSARQG